MDKQELTTFLESTGKDPSRLIFEDELTGIYNRRFLLRYLDSRVPWGELNSRRLSLLMMDLDYFKSINDNYGHDVGDRALIWLAQHLKASVGEDGLPIRYAGDEFMLLLEISDKPAAVTLGQEIIERLHANPFHVPEADTHLTLTLSVGVATVPSDAADMKAFVHKADMALYLAKQRGRDRLVDAAEVAGDEVSVKAAIYQLGVVKIVGRGAQLTTINASLKEFREKNNRFVVIDGAAGMGKTEFLEAVRKSLSRSNILPASAHGVPQEMYRPYYLAEQVLVDLLNQREDKGMSVLSEMADTELGFLSQILPRLAGDAAPPEGLDEVSLRKGIFGALVRMLSLLVGGRPLFLFIDDAHFGDEATILLLRRIMLRRELKLFVIATASESSDPADLTTQCPLERFIQQYHEELDLTRLQLTPLAAKDISQHIQTLFPSIRLPQGFCDKLAQISQGNPLFLAEILRKLVLDHQITLVGQHWTLHPFEDGYLPRSMEEIVTGKIAALDEESRQLLDQVSALGENVPLSMLIGSSDVMEAKVLEFIDQAVAQGLLASDFALNDENIRFLGKRVLEITYSAIEPERKEKLHEQIGTYQEGLYEKLQASAATLAFHFKRSNDTQKAETYERVQSETNARTFNSQEAAEYSGEMPSDEAPEEHPLTKEGLAHVPQLIRSFTVALRNIKLYPPGSKSVVRVNQDLKAAVDRILTDNECLSLIQSSGSLVINGQRMDISDFKLVANSFIQILDRFDLKGVAFHQGLTENELEGLTEELGRSEQKVFEETHWETFSRERAIRHIDLKQMRYAIKPTSKNASGAAGKTAAPRMADTTLKQIPDIIRSFLSAARTIKLYPITSNASLNVVKALSKSLRRFLTDYSLLSLSHVGSSLLVNGEKIDTSDFKALADGLIKYFNVIGLNSLTFLDSHTDEELKAFIGTLGELSPSGTDGKFWKEFSGKQQLSGILFDQHTFEVKVKHTGGLSTGASGGDGTVGGDEGGRVGMGQAAFAAELPPEPEPERAEIPVDVLIERLSPVVDDLLLNGRVEKLESVFTALFTKYPDADAPIREQALGACRKALENLNPAYQHDFARALANPMMRAFLKEENSKLIRECSALMHRLTAALLQFSDYPPAARMMNAMRKRQQDLRPIDSTAYQTLTRTLESLINPATQKLVVADFMSGDTERQRNAAQLLVGYGPAALPMLIDIVKTADDYRIRHVGVSILGKLGPQAADRLKTVLAVESPAEEKIRILEVLDALATDLRTEVLRLIGDPDVGVRQAALRLVERLGDSALAEVLLDLAKGPRTEVAVDAIMCLSRLKPPGAAKELLAVLSAAREANRVKACCLALGELGAPESIAPIARVIRRRSFFSRRKYTPEAKVSAAYALTRIDHPDARSELASFLRHADPRIREIAEAAAGSKRPAEIPVKGSETV